jgi:hypothetical protein
LGRVQEARVDELGGHGEGDPQKVQGVDCKPRASEREKERKLERERERKRDESKRECKAEREGDTNARKPSRQQIGYALNQKLANTHVGTRRRRRL